MKNNNCEEGVRGNGEVNQNEHNSGTPSQDNISTCSGLVEHKIVFGTVDWILSNTLGYATMIFPVLCCNIMGSGILDLIFFIVVFLVACIYILAYQACKRRLLTAWNFIIIKRIPPEKPFDEVEPDNVDPEAPFANPFAERQVEVEKEAYGFFDPPVCVNRIFNYDLFASLGLLGGCGIEFMFHFRHGTRLDYPLSFHNTFVAIEVFVGLFWLLTSLRLSKFTENTDPKNKLKLAVQWFNMSIILQFFLGVGLPIYLMIFARNALSSDVRCCFIAVVILWTTILALRTAAMYFILICIAAICEVAEEIEERSVWKVICAEFFFWKKFN